MKIYRFLNRFAKKISDERAFGIVEALLAMLMMSIVLLSLLGLLTASVTAISTSKSTTTANQLANKTIEKIRSMDYALIGLQDGEPSGILKAEETQTVDGKDFRIVTNVEWVDDESDGIGYSDDDGYPEGARDYKKVTITIYWNDKNTTKNVSVATFIKSKPTPTDPPTVNFAFGLGNTPDDGTVFYAESSQTPLKATATDPDGDLSAMRFYVDLQKPPKGRYDFDPTSSFNNLADPCYWDPNEKDIFGDYVWLEGTHEITVEVWDAHGNRDAKSVHYVIDREPPTWDPSANLAIQALEESMGAILSWQPAKDGRDPQVLLYNIYRTGPNNSNFSRIASNYKTAVFTYQDSGLSSWSTYQYYIKAVSQGGFESEASNIVSASMPFSLTATPERHGSRRWVTLNWPIPPIGIIVHHYDIYRNGSKINTVSSTTTYKDESCSKETTYTYRVIALTASNQEINHSITVSATTP